MDQASFECSMFNSQAFIGYVSPLNSDEMCPNVGNIFDNPCKQLLCLAEENVVNPI